MATEEAVSLFPSQTSVSINTCALVAPPPPGLRLWKEILCLSGGWVSSALHSPRAGGCPHPLLWVTAILVEGVLGRRPGLADPLSGSLPPSSSQLGFLAGLPYTGCLASQTSRFPSAKERVQTLLPSPACWARTGWPAGTCNLRCSHEQPTWKNAQLHGGVCSG